MQLVSVSRDLNIIWEEKNSSVTIKWQDGTCYRIQSGVMIFDLHLVPTCAESRCTHCCLPHRASPGWGRGQVLAPHLSMHGQQPGEWLFLQMLMSLTPRAAVLPLSLLGGSLCSHQCPKLKHVLLVPSAALQGWGEVVHPSRDVHGGERGCSEEHKPQTLRTTETHPCGIPSPGCH